eukprot:9490670-Pyramimonas_sp.AAC.1
MAPRWSRWGSRRRPTTPISFSARHPQSPKLRGGRRDRRSRRSRQGGAPRLLFSNELGAIFSVMSCIV